MTAADATDNVRLGSVRDRTDLTLAATSGQIARTPQAELDELRAKYADDPVALAALERQVERGREDAAEGRRTTKYSRVSCGVNVNRTDGIKGADEVGSGSIAPSRKKRTRL